MTPPRLLLNLDAGELPSETEELWSLFDVVNIACGGHAGDTASMTRVLAFCASRGRPRAGAHPSYPDPANFGRRSLHTPASQLSVAISSQCAALVAIARSHGLAIDWLKPHGALYHDAASSPPLAHALLDGAVQSLGRPFIVVGPPHGALATAAADRGLPYAREGFADRALRADGSLVPRSEPGALITDPAAAAAQALSLAASGTIDTLCIHADTPGSLAIARAVRAALALPAP